MRASDTPQARRAQRKLPATDERSVNSDRKKCVGVSDGVMVKKVFYVSAKFVRIKRPSAEWDSHPELVFFIALAVKRNETQVLAGNESQQWAGNRKQRRLVEVAIETAENPIQARNLHRYSDARTGGILYYSSREVCLPDTANDGKPRRRLELVLDEYRLQAATGTARIGEIGIGARVAGINQLDQVVVVLPKSIVANL